MRLKRVEMIGFKSFMDRTVLDFRPGITTVLGPNGCGKSNVVDAVRWVLGEQSAKQLRGEKMEDVIFKGTRKRKPMSMAEVSLVFDNSAQRLAVPYQEVSITRRVSRSGTSDYFLNKTPCRLKDIKDLFYDTGVGNNAYSVIEQEVVGQVLDPSENKVRTILEEGSGIVRYKIKRKEALRKLDLTERDLLRVEDIIDEIGKQVRSLARQVGKARRHQRLFGEVRALELVRAHLRLREIAGEATALRDRLQSLRAEGTGDDAESARLGAAIESMRPELEEREQARRQRAEAVAEIETSINAIEGELLVLREKTEAGRRRRSEIEEEFGRSVARQAEIAAEHAAARAEREALAVTLAEHESAVVTLEQRAKETDRRFESTRDELARAQQLSLGFLREEADQKQEITAARARLDALAEQESRIESARADGEERRGTIRAHIAEHEVGVDAAGRRRTELERELAGAQEEVAAADAALTRARELREAAADELARLESRLEIAQRIADELEGYRVGAAALLRDPERSARLRGAMAERLRVEKGYEAAFELVFGEDADALLVGDVRDARALADHLAKEGLGLASFLADTGPVAPARADGVELPGRPALDLVRLDDEAAGPLRRWLQGVRVVPTNDEAVEGLLAHAGEGVSFLSREGLFLRHDGLVRGGAGSRRQLSLFGRRDQVDQLQSERERRDALVQERRGEQIAADGRLEAARQRVEQLRRETNLAREELGRLQGELGSRRSLLQREEEQEGVQVAQRDAIREEARALIASLETMQADLGRHGVDQQASQRRLEDLGAALSEVEQDRERAHRELGDARLALTHDRGNDRELASRIERLAHMGEDLRARIERLEAERATLDEELQRWQTRTDERGRELTGLYEQRDARREALRSAQEEIDQRRSEADELARQQREVDRRRRERGDQLHEVESSLTKLEYAEQNLTERIQEKFHVGIEEGYAALDPEALPRELEREGDTFQLAQVTELLAERQDKLDKIGPVNFVALDEYEEKKQRLEFLEKQRDDLLSSKEDLLQAIDRINRTARQMFRDTYEQVRQNFREIFTTLFEGGEADLVLHKADDPLEGDIEVTARPSGKRIDSVSLLSGGERALTAIALLFAVYLIKPSPFCLLDEVDAPLDDMNIGRFVRLLERFSERTQFIVITHNKLTMEAADHLYGVTMEESGVSRLVSVSFDQLQGDDPIKALEAVAAEREEQRKDPAARLAAGEAAAGAPLEAKAAESGARVVEPGTEV